MTNNHKGHVIIYICDKGLFYIKPFSQNLILGKKLFCHSLEEGKVPVAS